MAYDRPARESKPASQPFNASSAGRPERATPPAHLLQASYDSSTSIGSASSAKYDPPLPSSGAASDYSLNLPILSNQQPTAGRPGMQAAHGVSFDADTRDKLGYSSAAGGPQASTSAAVQGDPNMRRKKSLVRPEREPIRPGHPLWNYRTHAAAMEADGKGRVGVSTTGNYPQAGIGLDPPVRSAGYAALQRDGYEGDASGVAASSSRTPLRRGKSILAREEDLPNDTGLSILKRGATLRKRQGKVGRTEELDTAAVKRGPMGPWTIYYRSLTCCCPAPILRTFGTRA